MDIQSEKYKLMEWLINLNDKSTISEIKKLKERLVNDSEWVSDISDAEKSIEKSRNEKL